MFITIITIFVFILISTMCICAKFLLHKQKEDKTKNIVIPASFVWWIAFACGALFSVFLVLSLRDKEDAWVLVGFAFFCWLGIFMMYGWLGSIITYDRDGFTVGYFPWQKKYYKYQELTSFKVTLNAWILFCGKKKITLDHMLMGDSEFEMYATNRYREICHKELPYNNSIPRWDIFNGHVESPGEFIFIGIMLLVITLIMPICQTYEAFDNVTEDETISMELQIVSYDIDDSTLILNAKNETGEFELWNYEKYETILSYIDFAIRSEQEIAMNVIVLNDDEEPVRYEIYNITNFDGKNIISFEDVNKVSNVNSLQLAGIFLIFFFIVVVFCIATIMVGRNPKKYSKKVQRIFFKDGYLKY